MLKQYIVFGGDVCDALGGWIDVLCESDLIFHETLPGDEEVQSFETVKEAVETAEKKWPKPREPYFGYWYHVVDLHTGKIVTRK